MLRRARIGGCCPRARRLLRPRRLLIAAAALLIVSIPSCFPGPIDDLWPPRPGEPSHRIEVVYHDWHTFIVEPRAAAAGAEPDGGFFEWEFAEKAWYLEGRQGIGGVFRALFWPSDSALSRKEVARPFWARFPERPIERWSFVVSEEGLRRLVAYAESVRGEPLAGRRGWYAGRRPYHLFFLCHHFTLRALREAGLPVAPWWGYTYWMTEIQLDRVARFHESRGVLEEAAAR